MFKIFKKKKSPRARQVETTELMDEYLNAQLQDILREFHEYDVEFAYPRETVSATQIISDLTQAGYDVPQIVFDIMTGRRKPQKADCELIIHRKI